jgi:hypothetical protein
LDQNVPDDAKPENWVAHDTVTLATREISSSVLQFLVVPGSITPCHSRRFPPVALATANFNERGFVLFCRTVAENATRNSGGSSEASSWVFCFCKQPPTPYASNRRTIVPDAMRI